MVLFWHAHSLREQQKFHGRQKILFFCMNCTFKIFMHSLPPEKKHSNSSSHNPPLVWNTPRLWQEVVTWLPSLKANEWVYQNRCLPAVSRGPNASARCFQSPACGPAWRLLEAENDWKSLMAWFYEAGVCRDCWVYRYDQLLNAHRVAEMPFRSICYFALLKLTGNLNWVYLLPLCTLLSVLFISRAEPAYTQNTRGPIDLKMISF